MKKGFELPAFPPNIDVDGPKERFPFCIVWTPLPFLTTIVPFIGHVGITDSKGRIYDFQGDYIIGKEHLLFGKTVKYLDLSRRYVPSAYSNPSGSSEAIREEIALYDRNLEEVIHHFRTSEKYSFIRNNCHDFVASVLNAHPSMEVELASERSAPQRWNVQNIMLAITQEGKYVSWKRLFQACWKSIVLYTLLLCVCLYSAFR